jgi:glucose-1-phosphate adenylyltransferase
MNHVDIGRNVKIRRAIIEKNTKIPDNTTIGYDMEADAERYFVNSSGITVVRPEDVHSIPSDIPTQWVPLPV